MKTDAEKLLVLCSVDDKNARSKDSKDQLIAYPEFQMKHLLSELNRRSDNRPKYSKLAFLGFLSKKGATLVAEISCKLEESYRLWSADENLVLRTSLDEIQDKFDPQIRKKTMSYNGIKRFIMFYQRITLQMLKDLSKSASIVMLLKKNHEVKKVLYR